MVIVSSLPVGSAFRVDLGGGCGTLDYRLIRKGPMGAYVEPLTNVKREIKNAEGDVLAEVVDRRGRTTISSTTPCTKLVEVNQPIKEGEIGMAKPMARGDRFMPPKQGRPIKQGTKRADTLNIFMESLTGDTDIRYVMKELGINRNLVVARIHEMWKFNGYGYTIIGDMVTIVDPLPCTDDDCEDLL